MNFIGAYVYFCDDNNLKRIDATSRDRRLNLLSMLKCVTDELEAMEQAEMDDIKATARRVAHWPEWKRKQFEAFSKSESN